MKAANLTPEQWKDIESYVMAAWRQSFDLCQWVVDNDFDIADPLYHHAAAMLGAICDMRRLVSRAEDGQPLPEVGNPKDLMNWVKPQDGGGCVPQKRKSPRR